MMIINPPFVPHILVSADMSITHVFQRWSIKNLRKKKYDPNDGYCVHIWMETTEKPRWYSCSLSFWGKRKFYVAPLVFPLEVVSIASNFFYTRSFFLFSRFYIFFEEEKKYYSMVWMLILEPFLFMIIQHVFISKLKRWPFIYFKFSCNMKIVPLKLYSIIYSHQQYQCSRLYQLRTSIEIEIFYVLSFFGFTRMKNSVIFSFFCFDGAINIPFECVYTFFFFFKRFITRQLFSYNLIKITVVVDRPFAEIERHLQCFRDFFFHFEWRRRTSEEHWFLKEFLLLGMKEKENLQEITLELDY